MAAAAHAIHESGLCIKNYYFCAGVLTLRKAVDLWSGLYRDHFGLKLSAAEDLSLPSRLRKIAEHKPQYKPAIEELIEGLELESPDSPAKPSMCIDLKGAADAKRLALLRAPFERLHLALTNLWELTYSSFLPGAEQSTQ